HPWLAARLYGAFREAKEISDRDLTDMRAPKIGLPWIAAHARATRDLMGDDFWPYGIEANRPTLELMTRYAHEQGLATRKLAVDELFVPLAEA
ncbi:MAG: ABC transporter substrate-binding protein, partial [Parvibaculaceae bacterium]